MHLVTANKLPVPTFKNHSLFSKEYLISVINYEASHYDWNIEVSKNQATIVSKNNHKYYLEFSGDYKFLSCSCKKFVEQELNWCHHCYVLEKWYTSNHLTNLYLDHDKCPDKVFFIGNDVSFYSPKTKQYFSFEQIAALENATQAAKNYKQPDIYGGIEINDDVNKLKKFGINLYQYQRDACEFMLTHVRKIISLDMGWGKTFCAINSMRNILELKPKAKILVISPKSLKLQWYNEIKKFLPEYSVFLEKGKTPINSCNITVTTYEACRDATYAGVSYDIMVLDEVQQIKNKDTQSWKGISKINSHFIWALSGTVVENSVEDFLSIVDIVKPSVSKVRWKFYDKYCHVQGKHVTGFKNSEDLDKLLADIIYRAPDSESKIDVKVNKSTVVIPMGEEQKDYHDGLMYEIRKINAMAHNRPLSLEERALVNALQTKARMISDGLAVADPSLEDKSSNKVDAIMEKILSNNEKFVVISQFKEMLTLIEAQLTKHNIKFCRFDGSLSMNARNKAVQEFISDDSVRIFTSSDIGGTGLDGLQKVCRNIIHCQNIWNPMKLLQRDGRLARLHQKFDCVNSTLFISKDSIEETSMQLNHHRKLEIKNTLVKAVN